MIRIALYNGCFGSADARGNRKEQLGSGRGSVWSGNSYGHCFRRLQKTQKPTRRWICANSDMILFFSPM